MRYDKDISCQNVFDRVNPFSRHFARSAPLALEVKERDGIFEINIRSKKPGFRGSYENLSAREAAMVIDALSDLASVMSGINEYNYCPACGSSDVKPYDGMLGYESVKCQACGHDLNDKPEFKKEPS